MEEKGKEMKLRATLDLRGMVRWAWEGGDEESKKYIGRWASHFFVSVTMQWPKSASA